MKQFRDLYINLNGESIDKFIDALTEKTSNVSSWERDKEREEKNSFQHDGVFAFRFNKSGDIPDSGLTLMIKETGLLYVPNIVPLESGELGKSKYNKILISFYENLIIPTIENTSITANLTNDEITIQEVAGEDIAKSLKQFSALANMSTGASHPRDQERWFKFLTLSYNCEDLYVDLVINTLIEYGWPEDKAYELGLQYEFSCDLLKYFQESRR